MSAPHPTFDFAQTPPIPFGRTVKVELRKASDTVSSFWLLVASAVMIIIVEGIFVVLGFVNDDSGISFDVFSTSMAYVLQPVLAILSAMLVTSEWGQRTAMVTFALEPRRARVLYAKLVAALALALSLVVVTLVVAVVCTGLLSFSGNAHDLWDFGPGDLVGLLLFELLPVVLGYAIATVALNTPAAVLAFPVVLYALPLGLLFVGLFSQHFLDFQYWINILTSQDPVLHWSLDTAKDWGRLLVSLILWVAVPLAIGQARVSSAEVK